jgi:hypothetical protein
MYRFAFPPLVRKLFGFRRHGGAIDRVDVESCCGFGRDL